MTDCPKRVGIIGHGHLGQFLIAELNKLPAFSVVKIWNRTSDSENGVEPLENLNKNALREVDLVVEVAHPKIVDQYAVTILESCDFFIGSPSSLADKSLYDSIQHTANLNRRSVFIPSGAFWGGTDIQKMADTGMLKALTITMTKHPSSFKLESPLKEINEQLLNGAADATLLYEGPVRGLCPIAPNNVNTMAGAAIAAHNLGFDGVTARLISDPQMSDWHIVEVDVLGPDGFSVYTKRKNPSKPGAVTGQLTYYSFLTSLKESCYKPAGIHIC